MASAERSLLISHARITLRSYEAFVDQVGVRQHLYPHTPRPAADLPPQWVFTTGLSLSTSVDVLITVSLIALLQRSRTGFSTMYVLSPLLFVLQTLTVMIPLTALIT